jgi:hypothetical protein
VKSEQHILVIKSFDVPEHLGGFVLAEDTIKVMAERLAD